MEKTAIPLFITCLLIASLTVLPQPTEAQTNTIVVPDDYSTIASAIGNATDGDTVWVKRGTYYEHELSVDKSIILRGENSSNTIINCIDKPVPYFGTVLLVGPTAIAIRADYIEVSGFTISCSGAAIGGGGFKTQILDNKVERIYLNEGSYQTISGNEISSLYCQGSFTYIVNNNFLGETQFTAKIIVEAPSSNNVICSNKLIGSSTYSSLNEGGTNGISVQSNNNLIALNFITNYHAGITIRSSASNRIISNTISNVSVGIATAWGSNGNIFEANNIENNTVAVTVSGKNWNNLFYDNNFVDNIQAIVIGGPPDVAHTSWYKENQGNFWSDYATKYPDAVEADNNGTGNIPYVLDANNIDEYPLLAQFNQNVTIDWPQWLPILITILSPENQQYNQTEISLIFTLNKQVTSLSYGIDQEESISIADNATIRNLINGKHNVTIYANDQYGNVASQTINFTVNSQIIDNTFTSTIIIVVVAAICAGIGLLLFRKNQKKHPKNPGK